MADKAVYVTKSVELGSESAVRGLLGVHTLIPGMREKIASIKVHENSDPALRYVHHPDCGYKIWIVVLT